MPRECGARELRDVRLRGRNGTFLCAAPRHAAPRRGSITAVAVVVTSDQLIHRYYMLFSCFCRYLSFLFQRARQSSWMNLSS